MKNAKTNRKTYTRIALTLSICLMIIWAILGTGTSLAWFTDTTPVQKNIFYVGELDVEVYHRTEDKTYEKVTSETSLFDDDALYEPGYVQVVYLKIKNEGDIPFDYKMAIGVSDYTPAINVFGQSFNLHDHLRFGLVIADSEAELEEMVAERENAKTNSTDDIPLSTYSTDTDTLAVGEERYAALIVRMPEEVGNIANHNGKGAPKIELGLIVKATQKGTPIRDIP